MRLAMHYTQDILEELDVLTRFSLHSQQEGIKVRSSADASLVAATERLFNKGLITQKDGGYLTSLGLTAAEHNHGLLQILES